MNAGRHVRLLPPPSPRQPRCQPATRSSHSREGIASARSLLTFHRHLRTTRIDKRLTVGEVCSGSRVVVVVCRDGRRRAPLAGRCLLIREPHFEVRFAIVCVGVADPRPPLFLVRCRVVAIHSLSLSLSLPHSLPAVRSSLLYSTLFRCTSPHTTTVDRSSDRETRTHTHTHSHTLH